MGTAADKIFEEAISLPADERASLVERLIQSLNLPTQTEIGRLWAEEAERRVSQIQAGTVKLISGEQVFAKIRAKHRR
jgi:putative addiction module component (TIGR02574 family)